MVKINKILKTNINSDKIIKHQKIHKFNKNNNKIKKKFLIKATQNRPLIISKINQIQYLQKTII